MYSAVDICNLALAYLSVPRISSLNDEGDVARSCNQVFDMIRDAVLEEHDWSFARKELALAEIDESYGGWAYTYAYPDDCIVPRSIIPAAHMANRVNYEIRISADSEQNLILSDQEAASLLYTARIENTVLFAPLFVSGLSVRLAADLALPLRSDANMAKLLYERYRYVIGFAAESDAGADYGKATTANLFVEART